MCFFTIADSRSGPRAKTSSNRAQASWFSARGSEKKWKQPSKRIQFFKFLPILVRFSTLAMCF